MSALKTIPGESALPVRPIAHDQARALLGQVMGLVAVTVGFAALGAYLGRDLSGATSSKRSWPPAFRCTYRRAGVL